MSDTTVIVVVVVYFVIGAILSSIMLMHFPSSFLETVLAIIVIGGSVLITLVLTQNRQRK
jgi:hypothetical protein